MTEPTTEELVERETIARIVDPYAWDLRDSVAEYQSRPQGEAPWTKGWENQAWEASQRTDVSLAKADFILEVVSHRLSDLERERADLEGKLGEARKALEKINGIRNSIIGVQGFNWSEHAYPLVAALEEAGFAGLAYPEARAYVGSLLDQIKAAEAALHEIAEQATEFEIARAAKEALKLTASGGGEDNSLSSAAEHSGSSTPRTSAPSSTGDAK